MKTLINPYFIFFSIIWLIVFSLTKFQIYLPNVIQFYLLDTIVIPVLANLGLWFLRLITLNNSILLMPWHLIFIVLSVSVFFEILMPIYKPIRYTADIYDIVCYILGGMFFWKWMNKSL